MITDPMPAPSAPGSPQNGLLHKAKRLISGLSWLSPTASLSSKGSTDFGRQIEASLAEITQGSGILRLQLRKRDTAVVMSVDHYEEMVRMKAMYAELVERVKEMEIAEGADEYEALYHRITSVQSREAADDLFAASSEDLRKTYQPGKTETQ